MWEYPGEHMDVDKFKLMWIKLMMHPSIHRVLLNNTGDMYIHPKRKELWEFIEKHHYKPIIMTTNAAAMDYVPDVDLIIISFNGGTKETYEHTTGLSFDKTVARIKKFYPEIAKIHAEIHCLIWDGNEGTEDALKELWEDFPGRIRVSYKYDNQMKEDHTIEKHRKTKRVTCDYLSMLSVMPTGQVVSCAHDFGAKTDFGNVFTDSIDGIIWNDARKKKIMEHIAQQYTGICEKCNYNTATAGRFVYLK